MVQLSIQKCLEKEAICNELYLQLIKQTTDQPDPNGRINIQNWRFLCLLAGVVVPRNRVIVSYLQAHLRRCGVDAHTEEGRFAQFAMQVCVCVCVCVCDQLWLCAVFESHSTSQEQKVPSLLSRSAVYYSKVSRLCVSVCMCCSCDLVASGVLYTRGSISWMASLELLSLMQQQPPMRYDHTHLPTHSSTHMCTAYGPAHTLPVHRLWRW